MSPVPGGIGGGRAAQSGRGLEGVVRSYLEEMHDFKTVKFAAYERIKLRADRPPRLLVKNVPYTTIYGTEGKTEFLVDCLNPNGTRQFPFTGSPLLCRIECKRQQSAGSVDEKYPYLYLSCVESMTETNIILLCEISGARAEARQWLINAIANRPYASPAGKAKLIHLMQISDFMTWADNEF